MSRDWSLARALAGFNDVLRANGATVSPAEAADALRALERIGPTDRRTFAQVLRCCLAKTPEDRLRFDAAFDRFWGTDFTNVAERVDAGAAQDTDAGRDDVRGVGEDTPAPVSADAPSDRSDAGPSQGASASPRLMAMDFAAIDVDERAAMDALIRTLGRQLARRAARRWVARRRGRLALRESLKTAIAHGGELFEFKRRDKPRERPRLVVFADVSYSMDAYSRFFLCFVHAFGQCFRSVESFVFSTRLSRVTHALRRGPIETALARLPDTVQDWAGGTRIAGALETYLQRFADQQLDRNTVVMIVSDGWDSDAPERLTTALERLRARCAALIWLDPLMGHPRYFSTALGVQHDCAAVDLCAPARDLAGLEALVDRLSRERIV